MRCTFPKIHCCLLILVLVVFTTSATARTWRVPADAPTVGAGIDSASAGDEVVVASGDYTVPPLFLISGITLRSESGDPVSTTLRWTGDPGPILDIQDVTDVSVEGFTLTGFNNPINGGGGVAGLRSTFSITNCIIRDNISFNGGGMRLRLCTDVLITDCLFHGNSSQADGGGLALGGTTAIVENCTFSNNTTAQLGAAICADQSFAIIQNCTITGNSTGPAYGAIYIGRHPLPVIYRSIIAFNIDCAGLVCQQAGTVPSMQCCDIFGNEGGDWGGCLSTLAGVNGNISEDPQFCSSQPDVDQRWTLQSDSPCLWVQYLDCPTMGAWPVGCQTTASVNHTWGQVKTMYR